MLRTGLRVAFFVATVTNLTVGAAAEVPFRRHVINAESEFSACAAIDVNGNGRLDIVSGAYWYEAPHWTRHPLRDVPRIGDRYDDYSNLPLDVNGNGRPDLISINYRSQSLYWVENRGLDTPWPSHVIDTPGPSESGRLYDIDGDGRLDVLPNGMKFAAWYEVVHDRDDDGRTRPRWIRHELPESLIGHGIGFGDVNGDGRGDVVGSRGWAEAPQDARHGQWIWHPEFTLHADASVPILVHDVDGDGDADLIWGRGHNIGLYWMEQTAGPDGQRRWIPHVIDTSWSQAHCLMLADIDGSGQMDLVAGKRYLGHGGRDPGEYDPLVIYWYRFDRTNRTWQRHLISHGADCGFDLDPKCVDIDGDGDVDVLAPTRNGLFLLENLRLGGGPDASSMVSSTPPAEPDYPDHTDTMVYRDADGQLRPIETAWDWGIRRWHILQGMQQAMGPFPEVDRRVPLDVQVLSEEDAGTYVRRKITYAAEPGDRVPAYLLIPKQIIGRAPAMLCLHPTSPLGKSQICGLEGRPSRFYAHELAERGYVCLAPDYPSFGDYEYDFQAAGEHSESVNKLGQAPSRPPISEGFRGSRSEPVPFSHSLYASGSMKGIWNHIRGVDLLETMPEVHPDRIGCIGHSLGGHNALFVAAFDQRLRTVVTSCGFTAFAHYYEGNLTGWTSDRYMPRIRDVFGSDPRQVPFDFHELLAAMAPRPVFVNAPLDDSNFEVEGVREVIARAGEVYKLSSAADNLQVVYPDAQHDFPDEIRQAVYQWLDRHLKR